MNFKYFIIFVFLIFLTFEVSSQDNASEVNTLLSRLDESQDENKRASIRLELARLYRQQNNFDESIRYYILAKHILDRTKKEVGLLALINEEIGLLYQSQKGYEKSITYFRESQSLRKQLNDTDGQIRSLNYAAWSYYQIPHYSSAIQTYEKILDIHHRKKNFIEEVKVLNRLAIISELNGQLDEALEYSNRELAISRSLNNLRGLAKAHNNIAYLQRRKGLTKEALRSFNQAIDIYKKMLQQNQSQDEKAAILSNLGIIHTNIGAYAPAYGYFGQALQIRRRQQEPAKIGNVFNQIAANYFLKGDFERARINALSAVKQARLVDAWGVLIDSYRILADISEAEGNIQDYRQYSEYQTELENKLKEESNKRDTELLRK
ncbi:MAG: tetratricopeptide repeat protein, partial [Bacteroidota bacterium]